jgi:antitoxin CcdA
MTVVARRRPQPQTTTQVRTRRARKALISLSLRADLVQRARALALNLSEVVEGALEQAIIKAEQARWLAENQEAIDFYNSFVEKHGMFGDAPLHTQDRRGSR